MEENKEVTVVEESVDISHAKELVAVRSQELQLNKAAHKQMLEMAEIFFKAEALPKAIKNAPQVYMMLKAGRERGMSEVESLNAFYFVNGKLTMYGPAVIAQVIKAGHIVEWGDCDTKKATVKITRGDTGKSREDTLTIEEAKQAGGTSDIWKKYTSNMLKYRIFRMVANFLCPDALQGVSIESDTSFVTDPSGKIIDVEDTGVMSQGDIRDYYTRLTKKEGYSRDEINVGIQAVLNRDTFGDLTTDEAEVLENWLKAKRNEPTESPEQQEEQGDLL